MPVEMFPVAIIRKTIALIFLSASLSHAQQQQQQLIPLDDADSNYVRKFLLKNDIRIFYGLQGNNVSLGSSFDDNTKLNGDLYHNTNDYIGAGITYGWLDGDLSFALPGTTYLRQERSNLTQFKLSFSYTRRKVVFRWHYVESTGVIVSGSESEFESTPSLHEMRLGMQITCLFNSPKYSYRASMYQTEFQVKTAGSFLIRFEPFYRRLGTKDGSMIPPKHDIESRFGEQTGLEYIQAPGLLISPGYGINIALRDTRFFISPIVFAGLGVAHNMYNAANGEGSFTSMEYAANAVLNAGYNGDRYYAKIQFSWSSGYTSMKPTYLTNSNLTGVVTWGIRFKNLK